MKTTVCIAGGASLTPADVDYCRGRARVVVVNNGYVLAPWADALYAADMNWWWTHADALQGFRGEKWTCDVEVAKHYGATCFPLQGMLKKGGGNGGFQALEIAARDAKRVILLGYDMGETGCGHWHADHDAPLGNPLPHVFQHWLAAFSDAAHTWRARGVEIINCTRASALTCFPRAALEDALP